MSTSNVRGYIYKASPTWLPKHELNKDNRNRHDKVNEGKPKPMRPKPYTKYRQLWNSERGRNILLHGREYA